MFAPIGKPMRAASPIDVEGPTAKPTSTIACARSGAKQHSTLLRACSVSPVTKPAPEPPAIVMNTDGCLPPTTTPPDTPSLDADAASSAVALRVGAAL